MRKLYLLLFAILYTFSAVAQTLMPLPVHNSVYSGSARGYWFIAPLPFTITGLRVPPEAGTGLQYIHVMKCHTPFPIASSAASTNFTTLTFINGATNGVIQNVNIPINAGDTIGILGTAGVDNSYATGGPSTIAGLPVSLTRFGYQGDINIGPAPSYWGEVLGDNGSISRIEMYYVTGPCTDPPTAGTSTASSPLVCAGGNVQLGLTGGTSGSGQTYVWESSVSSSGPFTPISTSGPSPSLNISPMTTMYYRAAVTCGTGTDYSVPVQVATTSGLSGTYTINSALPTGGTNFQSFAAAMAALSCGVSGPLTINVAPGSGPYTEQVTIPQILNASASSPVVINGNGNTLQFTPVSGARFVLRLDGADYVTINNLNITGLDATYGWGIHFMNSADYNTISNCTINLSAVTSTTTSNSVGIVATASATSATSDGDNGSFNTITSNTIIGGYRSITWLGTNGLYDAVGNVFSNNIMQDFYADGFFIEDNDGTIISGNDLSKPTRTSVPTSAGMEIGAGCKNMLINGNRIHDTHTSATTGTFYGIFLSDCDAPIGAENKITNNVIYKVNSSSGTIYALYNADSDGAHYFHNTVVLDHAAATSGTTRAFFQNTVSTNIQFKNNILHITRGGSGTKYCIYIGAASSIISNNNNLYIAAPSGSNNIGYYSGGFATLANWKTANSAAYDQQSVSLNSMFANAAAGDFTPTNALLDDLGTPAGVLTDVANQTRSATTPDIGAYEFLNMPLAVRLNSFSASRHGEDVMVKWNVSEEKGVSAYAVQRSADGVHFVDIEEVKATNRQQYQFIDLNGLSAAKDGKLYYRLKMVEANGQTTYSKISVVSTATRDELLAVYPNPFSESISISVSAGESGICTVFVKDITGRTVANVSRNVEAGTNLINIDGLAKVAQGSYQVVVNLNGKLLTQKVMK